MTRPDEASAFLAAAGWNEARRQPLAGDASARRYERLTRAGESAILMDAPPDIAGPTGDFVRIARHLAALGLSAPRILASDEGRGFMLLEDLGDSLFARILEHDRGNESALYRAAVDVLLRLQGAEPPAGPAPSPASAWAAQAALAGEWYAAAITGTRPDTAPLCAIVTDALERLADGPRVLALRDYHAENLLWLPERKGLARVGLLDFQDAQMGQPEYDLVSLVQDARRDVSPEAASAAIARFVEGSGRGASQVSGACAALGAMRALRILGVFARLCLRDGKPRYLALVPRVWEQLRQNLAHPALAGLARECERIIPPASEGNLQRIGEQCGRHPSR